MNTNIKNWIDDFVKSSIRDIEYKNVLCISEYSIEHLFKANNCTFEILDGKALCNCTKLKEQTKMQSLNKILDDIKLDNFDLLILINRLRYIKNKKNFVSYIKKSKELKNIIIIDDFPRFPLDFLLSFFSTFSLEGKSYILSEHRLKIHCHDIKILRKESFNFLVKGYLINC